MVRPPVIQRRAIFDALLIIVGSFLYAVGVDCFQVPNGLAAGGITGLATVINAVGLRAGVNIPIGFQGLVVNALLLIPVIRTGGKHYLVRTLAGILFSNLFVDALAPVAPTLGGGDILLCALWGGVISGLGLGLVFRSGGNTGGTDIIAQLFSGKTAISIGVASAILDAIVIGVSIPVFSVRNALYALICMYVASKVVDYVIAGPSTSRAAYIISTKHDRIANQVMYEMHRGCTELQARGVWSGNSRPVLFVVLSRSEINCIKTLVSDIDPEALVVITEVYEALGQGFGQLGA